MVFKHHFKLPRFSKDQHESGHDPKNTPEMAEKVPSEDVSSEGLVIDAEATSPPKSAPESGEPGTATPDNVTPLKEAVGELVDPVAQELAEVKAKLAETHDHMLRVAAEAENARKRMEKEKQETRIYCIQEFARDLLPVVDAFDKAISLIEQNPFDANTDEGKRMASIVEGVHMTSQTFHNALKKHGVERLPGKDNPFNPSHHNAISKEVAEIYTHEIVVEEFVSGYKIGERVLRTALVKVGSPK